MGCVIFHAKPPERDHIKRRIVAERKGHTGKEIGNHGINGNRRAFSKANHEGAFVDKEQRASRFQTMGLAEPKFARQS